jgi:fructose-1-phosphate kinase PfkB-like protein
VDPTGAGNAFLGGLAMGLRDSSDDPVVAAIYGQVAASFAIEQVGLPTISGEGEDELWNGVSVEDRLKKYMQEVEHLRVDACGYSRYPEV